MLRNNSQNTLFITLLTLTTVILNAESSIYIEYFPNFIKYLDINEEKVEHLLISNYMGLFISGLIVGPFSDCYGRKKIFIKGLALYLISSFACFLSDHIIPLLIARFVEGIAASMIMVTGWTILFDRFSTHKLGKLSGIIKGLSSLLGAIIPLFAFWIGNIFNWHIVLLLISILSIISLILAHISVIETLPEKERKNLHLLQSFKKYLDFLKNTKFISYILIYKLSGAIYVLFLSNASVVFVHNLGVSEEKFSIYQSIDSGVYIIFSFLSVYLIAKKEIDYTKNLGFIVFLVGCISMFITEHVDSENFYMLFISKMTTSAGIALMSGFLLKAVKLYSKDATGTAMSFSTAIGIPLISGSIRISEFFFDKTMLPTVLIVTCYAVISIILFVLVNNKSRSVQNK